MALVHVGALFQEQDESPGQSFEYLGITIEFGTEELLPREKPSSETTPCCIDLRPDTEEVAFTEGTEIDRDEETADETPDAFTTSVLLLSVSDSWDFVK
jgi:hypothetical protein